MDNIFVLHKDLTTKKYTHGAYESFFVNDPKRRHINKANVADRLVHHAIYRLLYPFFDKTFIFDSYSCRLNKGTHKAIKRFRKFIWKESKGNTRSCWVLQCDIKKFFASINHKVLIEILKEQILDKNIILLLENIIESYHTKNFQGTGLPLGNLTSQLFTNIYMNKFDQFVKHNLKVKYYIRYADDFVFLSHNKYFLKELIVLIDKFLYEELKLKLHPNKVFLKNISSGIDFLGYVNFIDYRVLRTRTKKRMFKKIQLKKVQLENKEISKEKFYQTLNSYLGLLKHGDCYKLSKEISEHSIIK